MPRTKESQHFKTILKSIKDFSFDFHKSIAEKTDGNFVPSPLSAHLVLSMAACGAESKTKDEMWQALHLPGNEQLAHQGFQALNDAFNSARWVTLKVANKIYTSDSIKIKEHFKEITSTYFQSESDTVDFLKSEEAANKINKWCSDQTNGKITDLIHPDMLTQNTTMVLLNALYFIGSWKYKFWESASKRKPFHVNKTTTIEVPTMYIVKEFYYKKLKGLNVEIVGLPYENPHFRMLVIIPKEVDGLKELEKNLKKIKLNFNDIIKSNRKAVELYLPKFKVDTTLDLKTHLEKLGMVKMFSSTANFNGISNERLVVNRAMQKAFININEIGTEAAAATFEQSVLMSRTVAVKYVVVDRPFLYMIVYKDCILFSGRIVNPLEP